MCPLWPFHIVILYFLMLAPLWLVAWGATVQAVKSLPFKFHPASVELEIGQTKQIQVFADYDSVRDHKWYAEVEGGGRYIADVSKSFLLNTGNEVNWTSAFNVTANFLGRTSVKLKSDGGRTPLESSDSVSVTVTREKRLIDKIFTYSVVLLVSILYINFGCALDWKFLKETIQRPIGPLIGFGCQFLCMPLISYVLGKLLFPDMPEMQLGLFFMGLSPGGGASNIWSVALEANVDLSIAMTTISTIAAFGMIPFWLFTLGRGIFNEANLTTPYSHIMHYVICLIVPLGIGYAIQRFLPRVSKILVRLLKPCALAIIVFIIVFACITSSYIFQLFTWQIFVAGLGLPWLGYTIGYLASLMLGQPFENVMAIAIETGVQNSGIAIFMLRFALKQPSADLTTVIPVAVSVMTPVPLAILYLFLTIRSRRKQKECKSLIVHHGIVNDNMHI